MTSLRALSCTVGVTVGSLLLLSSCVVFEPIGKAISNGYENTVAYFNSYYNAKRLFADAENEILTAQRDGRTRGIAPEDVPVPTAARQKLTTVIDKCSNVLSFYPESRLVDDALFLIGKSYYYQADFLKAERKFAEMLSQYPNSSIILDARLWYLKTLNRLKKDSEAEKVAQDLFQEARENGEDEIAAEGYENLGVIYSRQGEFDKSIGAFREALKLSTSDEVKAEIEAKTGAELYRQGKFSDAAQEYARVPDYTSEVSLIYASKLEEIRCLRQAGELPVAVRRCNEMLDDYRFVANINNIKFERGQAVVALGDVDRGMTDLIAVDTSTARTELGVRAAFALANLYSARFGNYQRALEEYAKSLAYPVAEIAPEARRLQTAMARYISMTASLRKIDSLLTVVDSARSVANPDSSLALMRAVNSDSLKAIAAIHAYGIGDVFYADLELPDSAVAWYALALTIEDTVRTPRIMFILAELSAAHPEKHYEDSKTVLSRIVEKYPRSVYAMRAKIQLGFAVEETLNDPGEGLYHKAEASLDSGNTRGAMNHFRLIAQEYPLSPYAAKSVYTVGWLYEHVLQQPDSAISEYRLLVQTYAGSPYANAVKRRIPAPEVAPPDSNATSVRRRSPDKDK